MMQPFPRSRKIVDVDDVVVVLPRRLDRDVVSTNMINPYSIPPMSSIGIITIFEFRTLIPLRRNGWRRRMLVYF